MSLDAYVGMGGGEEGSGAMDRLLIGSHPAPCVFVPSCCGEILQFPFSSHSAVLLVVPVIAFPLSSYYSVF